MGESPDTVRRDGEAEAVVPVAPAERAAAGKDRGSSTVQLKVRDVDSHTKMLRLPVDNATTTLRVPTETAEAAEAEATEVTSEDAGTDTESEQSATTAEPAAEPVDESADEPAAKPTGVDPRLAMRDGRESAGAALKTLEKPSADEPSADDSTADESAAEELSADEPETEEADDLDTAADLDAPDTPDTPDEPEAADLDAADEPAEPESAESAESAEPPAEKPAAGTVPEPPAEPEPEPAPLPEPEPTPTPEPVPAPKPRPLPEPTPTPEPLPVPDPVAPPTPAPAPVPAPVPPVPVPVPPPAPMPAPETTSEAMEVLAALSARPVSPLRRALKRITIWTVFLGLVLGVAVVAQLLRPLPDPKTRLSLSGSYTFAGDALNLPWPGKGQATAEVVGVGTLGSSGPETPAPIASVTKVMNALLILQDHPLKKGESGPKLTVDKQAAQESSDADQSRVTLTEGQQLTQYEALEMLMLPSANNVARLLARWDAGTEDAFVKKMNAQAASLGMTNTTYADPAGYNNDTKSTAKDQLKLAELVMQNEVFRQVVATPDTNFNNQRIYNTNYLLSPKNGVIGVKTGSSTPAGSCLMWAAVKDIGGTQRMILGVTLGQPPTTTDNILKAAQTVSQKIITASQNGLTGQTLAKQGETVGYVDDGFGGKVAVVAAKDLTVAGWTGVTAKVTLDGTKLGHAVKAGTQVGTITAGEGDGKTEVPVTLKTDLAPPSIMSRLLRML
ncbi:serine hydrolase [Kitasatospora sp. MAP5-34]|uniref:serine hydrolase n=1 Tax=Kitasatospora sp. MAP5-34 TaxID=3035102 RepID=UPI00247727AD|nr:serine hydrolase [Kitasatospora sp. MAP5-34]MDH6577686.1 D-alanyl-D-alanine carboxypeptidase (penicillin-binding protein 5/6) [Kitasatospora sp. MAP5-34]